MSLSDIMEKLIGEEAYNDWNLNHDHRLANVVYVHEYPGGYVTLVHATHGLLDRAHAKRLWRGIRRFYEHVSDNQIAQARAAAKPVERVSEPPPPTRKKVSGWIYLIAAVSGEGLVKIGRTVDKDRRLHNLNLGSPVPLEIIHAFWSRDYERDEARLHEEYKFRRVKGEWFDLTPDMIEAIKRNNR